MNEQAVLRGKECPRTQFEVRRVAGSATYEQSKTAEILFSFKLSLFTAFIWSWNQRVWSLSLFRQKRNQPMKTFLFSLTVNTVTTDCSFNLLITALHWTDKFNTLLFWEENNVPEHSLKLEGWQGLQHINKAKQFKLGRPLSSFYSFSLFSHKNTRFEFYYLVSDTDDLSNFFPKTTKFTFNLANVSLKAWLIHLSGWCCKLETLFTRRTGFQAGWANMVCWGIWFCPVAFTSGGTTLFQDVCSLST